MMIFLARRASTNVDKNTWKLMEDAYDVERAGDALPEADMLPHLVTAMHHLALGPADRKTAVAGECTLNSSMLLREQYGSFLTGSSPRCAAHGVQFNRSY
jgi:hypothetical protein